MPRGLKRYYHTGHLHYITCSCYQRQRWLNTPQRRDQFLRILDEARRRYRFVVLGYVVMPEHFHLLISERQIGDPSKAMQVVKQRYAQRILPQPRRNTMAGRVAQVRVLVLDANLGLRIVSLARGLLEFLDLALSTVPVWRISKRP